jgi:hypothetical protein
LHSTVPGAIGIYDLPDLAASLAPAKLLLIGVTDGNGNTNNTTDIGKDLSVIKSAYENKIKDKLQIIPFASQETLSENFRRWLEN